MSTTSTGTGTTSAVKSARLPVFTRLATLALAVAFVATIAAHDQNPRAASPDPAEQSAVSGLYRPSRADLEDERLAELNRHIESTDRIVGFDASRIRDLELQVWEWKGAVLSFGALISLLELLQLLGAIRRPGNGNGGGGGGNGGGGNGPDPRLIPSWRRK